jgi:integrase
MPKHSTEFKRLVALARKHSSDGSTVTESEFLQDSNGNQREVDICIKSHVDGLPITISIECYDQERPTTDRALISTMLFSFARISAVLSLKRQDFYYQGPRRWLRFHEKGGKEHEMLAHHQIEKTIDEYLSKVSIDDKQPLFQSVNKAGTALSGRALNRHNAWAAIRKRARNAGFLTPVGCHTWRATGVTVYLENGGRLEHAQQMAAHESPRTTKLYDRTKDEITIGEVERIQL